MGVLDREIATYRTQLQALLDHANEYVLIKGTRIVGFFPTRTKALEAGYMSFIDEAFLVRQITAVEPKHSASRAVSPG